MLIYKFAANVAVGNGASGEREFFFTSDDAFLIIACFSCLDVSVVYLHCCCFSALPYFPVLLQFFYSSSKILLLACGTRAVFDKSACLPHFCL